MTLQAREWIAPAVMTTGRVIPAETTYTVVTFIA